ICCLLFLCLYILSYTIITRFKKNADFSYDDSEDATVNRIVLWLCTFTLAVSVGAVLLLPFSILSNEILLSFPENYYMQWLNGSLIHGLWNLVFLFSNLSLVLLMPFAYFFTESEGFAGSKKGVMARVYETSVMLLLLTLLVLGIVWVASAILDNSAASRESLYDLWDYYLPYLYSCISLFGVLLLLVCTPFGLSRMFSVTGSLLVKPRLLEDLDETLNCTVFEEAALSAKMKGKASCWINVDMVALKKQFLTIKARRLALEMRRKASPWQRNLCYPLAMLLLLGLTGVSVLIVCFHVLELLIDEAAMPRGMEVTAQKAGYYHDKGITRFDLLGDFGRFNWLRNFYIVFLYNMLFAGLTTMCLVNKFTWAVQAELIRAFVDSGDSQGCVVSPTLFNSCIDWVLGRVVWFSGCGASAGEDRFTDLDNAVMFAESMEAPIRALEGLSKESECLGL
ncbi:LMBRL protein, partial [Polypterus senegalus]